MYRVTAPVKGVTTTFAGVSFVDSVATVDDSNTAALAYFRRHGYRVEPVETVDESAPETSKVDSSDSGEAGGSEDGEQASQETPKPARSSKAVR